MNTLRLCKSGLLLILIVLCLAGSLNAETRPFRVAVVPFSINAEKDFTYLKNGIADMLTSRLAWANKVAVLGREQTVAAVKQATGPLNEIQAQILGAKLEADYVLFGSVTIFGNSVSLDAKMVDVSGQRQTLSFFNQAEGMGKVIPQINLFATDINAKVFGRQVAAPVALSQATAATAPGRATPAPVPEYDIHAHPEKLLRGGLQDPGVATGPGNPFVAAKDRAQGSSLNPAFQTAPGAASGSAGFWKSPGYNYLLSGIETADVNGDGLIETVVATPHKVIIYQGTRNRMMKIYEHDTGKNRLNISVDIADINHNGTPEIFITRTNLIRDAVNSTVLEFDGNTFQVLVENFPWYFRVAQYSGRKLLLGQRQQPGKQPFADAISELAWSNQDLVPTERLLKGGKVNVLGTVYGDVENNGGASVLAYNRSETLNIYTPSGKRRFKGNDSYGGNLQHLVLDPAHGDATEKELIYLPTRIRLADLDKNGQLEIVLLKNDEMSGKLFKNFRTFKNGWIESLHWDGVGFAPLWKTRKITGRLQDFALGDFDNDGRMELLIAVISAEGRVVGSSSKSFLMAYELSQ